MKTESDIPKFYLHVEYNADFGDVVVTGSEDALKLIADQINSLITREARGAHFHLDKSSGLEGNCTELTFVKASQ